MKLAQSRQRQNAGRAQQQFSAVKKAASSVGSAISGAAKAVGSALKTKPIVRKPGQTSVRTRGGGAPQVAKPQQTQTQTTQPAPKAQQAQQTQAKPQGQSRFGKPQQPVKSPLEAGMGSGAEKARAMAKARIAAKNAGTAGPKLSGRERAQQMAKERIAAKNKSSNTVPSGSFGISAKGREQAAANKAEVATTKPTQQQSNVSSASSNLPPSQRPGNKSRLIQRLKNKKANPTMNTGSEAGQAIQGALNRSTTF